MKAILVVDMPTDCEDCPFGYDYRCFNTWKRFEEKEENRRITYPIPKWCPLKPMPKRKDILDSRMKTAIGWNECIEEIEKPEIQGDLSTDDGWWRDYELYEMQND